MASLASRVVGDEFLANSISGASQMECTFPIQGSGHNLLVSQDAASMYEVSGAPSRKELNCARVNNIELRGIHAIGRTQGRGNCPQFVG